MKKRNWNTYATRGYTFDVANDQPSSGGVHHHQVRRGAAGWQTRILQSNGEFQAPGPVVSVTDAQGEAYFATAQGGAQ